MGSSGYQRAYPQWGGSNPEFDVIIAVPLLALLAQSQPVDTTRKTTLPAVSVEAEAFKPARYNATTRFDEFYRRKARGVGKLFTREDIEGRAKTEAIYLLDGVAGVRIIKPKPDQPPELRVTRCGVGTNSSVPVFVNGLETGPNTSLLLKEFHVNDIEAMEVYTGPSQLPPEAMGNACGAIFIWTRYASGSVLKKEKDESTPAARSQVPEWPQHSRERPQPPVVTPPPLTLPVAPPAGVVVLFDGTSLANWRKKGSDAPAGWKVENGYMEIVPGTGDIQSTYAFGDAQLHIEYMTPAPPRGKDQDRGNSGVFLMGMYEVQVLDSFENVTYPDGQNAALYGDTPPAVNASRPPGEWQSYDITFTAPRFDASGKLLSPARQTVFHNGVKVHDAVALKGRTTHHSPPTYQTHAECLPLSLQDHDHPVRFRNIWVKELK